jgi:DNA-binding NtrC family response regulator
MDAEILLIVDDDPVIAEALAAGLEKDGRTIILCSDVESAEIIVEHYPVTRILADVQMTGRRFGFEGLQLLDHFREHAPQSPVVLMSGAANASMEEEAKSHGAIGLLAKPFELADLEALLLKDRP